MTYLKSILHGIWTGGVAGIVSGALFGMILSLAMMLFEGDWHESGMAFLTFGLSGGIVGLPVGLIAGAICGLLFSIWIDPQDAVRLGTVGGVLVGSGVAVSLQPISWSTDWVEILAQLGFVVLGIATGAFGGYLGGRLYIRYT